MASGLLLQIRPVTANNLTFGLMNFKRILLLFLATTLISTVSYAQKEKYQSLFIYNFSKYIKWPESYNSGKFVIGVIGSSPILQNLKTMTQSKKKTASGAVLEVVKYNSVDEIDDCNILFVSSDAVDELNRIDSKTSSKPILIVTDTPGMAMEGAVINFVEKNGKIKFELNQKNAESRKLVVSASLASLAILI